ncbi:MAG TPA: hypothetical protein VN625_08630 [Desulfuromonadaceae bacterium]|nr:hypothetical protein [Desulfuromonadaceae bacterium]
MNIIKHVCLTLVQLFKQIYAMPVGIFGAIKTRQRRVELKALEAERLDRIRNPSKYRGK